MGMKFDDTKYNKVNLTYADHILAHYYLMKCGGEHTKRNEKAIKVLTSCTRGNMTIDEAVEHRDELQKIFTQHMIEISNKAAINRLLKEQVSLHN